SDDSLPVITYILSFLPIADRKEASLVNHTWYFAAQDSLRQVKPTPPCSPHPRGVPTVPVLLSPLCERLQACVNRTPALDPTCAQVQSLLQAAGLLGHHPQGRPLMWPPSWDKRLHSQLPQDPKLVLSSQASAATRHLLPEPHLPVGSLGGSSTPGHHAAVKARAAALQGTS
uniref:Uncharacterized protein n=1 Tax=Chelydra serpentina TaxID=8475 RepID=A0A8C3SHI4_CHESE